MNQIHQTADIDYFIETSQGKRVDLATQTLIDFRATIEPIRPQMVFDSLRLNQVIAIPVVVNWGRKADHVICFLIYNNLCFRIDCTNMSREARSGITTYRIGNPKEFFKKIQLLTNSFQNEVNYNYLLNEFLKEAELIKIHSLFKPPQTVGDCCFKSSENLIYTIILVNVFKALTKHLPGLENENACLENAEKITEHWFDLFMLHDRERGVTSSFFYREDLPRDSNHISDLEKEFERLKPTISDALKLNIDSRSTIREYNAQGIGINPILKEGISYYNFADLIPELIQFANAAHSPAGLANNAYGNLNVRFEALHANYMAVADLDANRSNRGLVEDKREAEAAFITIQRDAEKYADRKLKLLGLGIEYSQELRTGYLNATAAERTNLMNGLIEEEHYRLLGIG